jgi:hypothetical protein
MRSQATALQPMSCFPALRIHRRQPHRQKKKNRASGANRLSNDLESLGTYPELYFSYQVTMLHSSRPKRLSSMVVNIE